MGFNLASEKGSNNHFLMSAMPRNRKWSLNYISATLRDHSCLHLNKSDKRPHLWTFKNMGKCNPNANKC